MMTKRWQILVVWEDGDEEYLMHGTRRAIFASREDADKYLEFMYMGMGEGVQSISVVEFRPQS
jgi:hypothetical protein